MKERWAVSMKYVERECLKWMRMIERHQFLKGMGDHTVRSVSTVKNCNLWVSLDIWGQSIVRTIVGKQKLKVESCKGNKLEAH